MSLPLPPIPEYYARSLHSVAGAHSGRHLHHANETQLSAPVVSPAGMGRRSLTHGGGFNRRTAVLLRTKFDACKKDEEGRVSLEELASRQASASTTPPKGSLDRAMTDDLDLEDQTAALLAPAGSGPERVSFQQYLLLAFPDASSDALDKLQGWSLEEGSGQASISHQEELPGSQSLTPGEVRRLHGAFSLHDSNCDGLLQRHELVEAVASCGYDSEEVEELLEGGGFSGDRVNKGLSFQEFVELVDDRARPGTGRAM